jgi:hypothetical protein
MPRFMQYLVRHKYPDMSIEHDYQLVYPLFHNGMSTIAQKSFGHMHHFTSYLNINGKYSVSIDTTHAIFACYLSKLI